MPSFTISYWKIETSIPFEKLGDTELERIGELIKEGYQEGQIMQIHEEEEEKE